MTVTDWSKLYKGFKGDDLVRVFAADVLNRFDAINIKLAIMEKEEMATLDDVLAEITAETTQVAGVATLISALQAQIAAALPPGTLTPEQQTEINNIFAAAQANSAALATALQSNVVPAPNPDAP